MNNVIDQWNAAAERFAADQEQSDYAEVNKQVVKARFPRLDGKRVLDLGCGYGFYTDYFRSIGADALGVDGSEAMLRIARERYPMTAFASMDITKPLAFADEAFDLVFANQVFMDIEELDLVFSQCRRILRPGGILYYSIVHPAFYDCHWLKNEQGFRYAKVMERYIAPYQFSNGFWGETQHFHRPLSCYLNEAAKNGFLLLETKEPVSYDDKDKNADLPLFFFAEYRKI